MRALLCHEHGPPESLRLEEVSDPDPPGEGQVSVRVQACGLNFPDTLIIRGLYQFAPPFPFSPGGEIAGVVDGVGPGVDGLREGDRVFGMTGWGGLAERMLLGADKVVPVPDGMDMDVAAAFTMAYGTTIYALEDRARLTPGQALLVLGAAGGVGLAAVELGRALGADPIVAAASTQEKLDVARAHGATAVIDYATEDLKRRARELTGGGADVVYDPVGGAHAEPALRAIGWGGRYLVVGFASGDIPAIPLNLVLLKSCQVVGVFWGAFTARDPGRNREHLERLLGWVRDGTLCPRISHRYPLEDAAKGIRDLMERRVIGKAVVTL